jgi:hypothetical protein
MTELAAHLVDAVLPRVPVRQWVLTVPYRLRYQMAWNHGLSRAVLGVYARLLDVYARGARERGIDGGQTGMVTALQRTGGVLNANLHFHTLVLDGVFIEEPGDALAFHPTPAPTPRSRRRSRRSATRCNGCWCAAAWSPATTRRGRRIGSLRSPLCWRGSLGCRAGAGGSSRGGRVRRLGDERDTAAVTSRGARQAHLDGFDLHANVWVSANDRAGLGRLCRLCGPPHKRQYADQGVMRTRHPRGWEER